jgi:branched-chain amino acid aminotransferase
MVLAEDLGYTVVEDRFTRDDLYCADEAFFTGTAAEVTPISEVDRRVIGQGSRGPVTKALQDAYFKVLRGENPKYGKWLARYSF